MFVLFNTESDFRGVNSEMIELEQMRLIQFVNLTYKLWILMIIES